MALHHQIRLLAEKMGPRIFGDAAEFRAAMDDYLGEDAMSSGEMNLLVDAIRLDAYDNLERLLTSGAPMEAAIISAGDTLSEKRGGDNPSRCRWAVACLGFATGRIDDITLSRYPYTRSSETPSTGAPTYMPPATPETAAAPQPLPQPAPQPPSRQRSWTWLFAAAAVLALMLGTAGLVVALDNDGNDTASETVVTTTVPMTGGTSPEPEPEASGHEHDDPVDPEEVAANYMALGMLENGIDVGTVCHHVVKRGGDVERIGCFDEEQEINMTLARYEDEAGLDATREHILAQCVTPGGILSHRVVNEVVRVYWDDTETLVSARLVAPAEHEEEIDEFLHTIEVPAGECLGHDE